MILKKFIRQLRKIKGRHTELVSVYIPKGYDINKIINHLQQEQGTANNIKDKRTRTNVIDSLEKTVQHLRIYKRTPENGLAVFAGNTSEAENKIDIKVWSIEPPQPLNMRLYRCDQTFVFDVLEDMLGRQETYGLIVLDTREANVGLLEGNSIRKLKTLTSGVPGKYKTGGQSAARFARIRKEMAKEFFNRIADVANKTFLEMKDVKGILIGGPGPTKETFSDGNFLNNEVKKKVIGIKDLGYTGEFGLQELVDKSRDVLAEEEITEEKNIMEKFFTLLAKTPEKVAYGKGQVDKAFELGAVKTLLLSENVDDELMEWYEEKSQQTSSELKIISTETREGKQLSAMGGIAAILRFYVT